MQDLLCLRVKVRETDACGDEMVCRLPTSTSTWGSAWPGLHESRSAPSMMTSISPCLGLGIVVVESTGFLAVTAPPPTTPLLTDIHSNCPLSSTRQPRYSLRRAPALLTMTSTPPRIKANHPFLLHPLMNQQPHHSSGPATALLVVDVQVGVVETCVNVKSVISNITSLIERAREAGAPVIWVQHEDPGLVRDSPGWAMAPGLPEPADGEVRIYKKHRDSFTVPELEASLHAHGIRHLVITGSQSDFCVRTTAQSAAVRGYTITVPRDAHTTEDGEYAGVKISAEQIIQHVNAYFDDFQYQPGVQCSNTPTDQVDFA